MAVASVKNTFEYEIVTNSGKSGPEERIGSGIASNVSSLENKIMKLYTTPEFKDKKSEQAWLKKNGFNEFADLDGARKAIEIKYQRAVRGLEAFMQLIRNKYDILKEQIRKLAV